MRNHDARYEGYEIGEGPCCSIDFGGLLGSVAAPLIGGLLGRADAEDFNQSATAAAQAAAPSLEVWGPAEQAAQTLVSEAERLYGLQGFSPTTNPLQLLGLQNQLGYAEGLLPQMVGAAQTSWLDALSPQVSPYILGEIALEQGRLGDRFATEIMPYISHNAQAAGGYGGSRQGVAEAQAAKDLMQAQGDLYTRMMSQAYSNELAAQQNAINQAGQMSLLGYLPGQGQQMIGDVYRQQAGQPAENLVGFGNVIGPYATPQKLGGYNAPTYYSPTQGMIQGALTGADLWKEYGDIFGGGGQQGGTTPATVPAPTTPTPGQLIPGPFGWS